MQKGVQMQKGVGGINRQQRSSILARARGKGGTTQPMSRSRGGSSNSRLPIAINTAIFTLSALRKVADLLGKGHFLMGPGKVYPGWLLPAALVTELATLVLLWVDRPLGVLGSAAFLGGVCHANFSPGGPLALVGPKALLPLIVAVGSTMALSRDCAYRPGPASRRLGLPQRPLGIGALAVAAGVVGFAFGAAIQQR